MSWFGQAVELLSDDSNTCCEAGHSEHAIRIASIDNGTPWTEMVVFDAEQYRDTPGYCPGDDDVSRTLLTSGRWETMETQIFQIALAHDRGIVIDIGTHVGWYTLVGLAAGRHVLAIEAVAEHEELTRANAARYGSAQLLHQAHCWVDEDTPWLSCANAPEISIAKIDIEGSELWALKMLSELITGGYIKNILMEISPIFNDTYPTIVGMLLNEGYTGAIVSPWTPFTEDDLPEVVLEHPQVDMIFALNPWWPL